MSQKTTLAIVNFSGMDITNIQVSNVSGFEKTSNGPAHLLNGHKIANHGSLCGYVEINNSGPSSFTVTLHFADNTSLSFNDDQQNAKTRNIGPMAFTGTTKNLEVWRTSGGNVDSSTHGTNGICIRSLSAPDNASWMGQVIASHRDVALCDLAIPGSHDAGMFETHDYNLGGGGSWAKTQRLSMIDQLKAGSRYFDIRVCDHGGHLVTYHGDTGYGAYGGSLGTIISDAKTFLQSAAGQSEVVILKFSHTYKNVTQRVADLVKTLGAHLYTSTDANINLATQKLSQMQGKVVAVFSYEFESYWNTGQGIFPYYDIAAQPGSISAKSLTVYDNYANDITYEAMEADQQHKLGDYGGWGHDYLFLLSWTLTGGSAVRDIEILAGMANPWLPMKIAEIKKHRTQRPNIVYMDFLDRFYCGAILELNK